MFVETQSSPDIDEDTLFSRGADAGGIRLTLDIDDSEIVEMLSAASAGRERETLAQAALKIGLLALRQAQGRIDSDRVRDEGGRLLDALGAALKTHRESVAGDVEGALKNYFDPESGRFSERVERLVKADGDLERVLRAQVAGDGSALVKTLADHTGPQSPLMQLIDPTSEKGLASTLAQRVESAAAEQRDAILKEFSLDNADGALTRTVRELAERHGAAGEALEKKVAEVVSEFSLDRDDSALSRLVARVDHAQKLINDEFSLDKDGSALARMRKEMLAQIEALAKTQNDFQGQVLERLADMAARKAEALKSTAHGIEFEDALFSMLQESAQKAGDVAIRTGATTGAIRNRKTGDAVIEIGPEHIAAGARIVVEAKEDASYSLKKAREEIEEARKNRTSEIGIFVFSRRSAPAGLDPLVRFGSDIFLIWDADDTASDIVLQAGLALAKGLAVQAASERADHTADFEAMDRAIREVEKQAQFLDDVFRHAQTVQKSGEKIEDRIRKMRSALVKQIQTLDEGLSHIKRND